MELDEQAWMIRETVARFVQRELIPLEQEVLQRMAHGIEPALAPEHRARLDRLVAELGLGALDAPEELHPRGQGWRPLGDQSRSGC